MSVTARAPKKTVKIGLTAKNKTRNKPKPDVSVKNFMAIRGKIIINKISDIAIIMIFTISFIYIHLTFKIVYQPSFGFVDTVFVILNSSFAQSMIFVTSLI